MTSCLVAYCLCWLAGSNFAVAGSLDWKTQDFHVDDVRPTNAKVGEQNATSFLPSSSILRSLKTRRGKGKGDNGAKSSSKSSAKGKKSRKKSMKMGGAAKSAMGTGRMGKRRRHRNPGNVLADEETIEFFEKLEADMSIEMSMPSKVSMNVCLAPS